MNMILKSEYQKMNIVLTDRDLRMEERETGGSEERKREHGRENLKEIKRWHGRERVWRS